MEKDIVQKGKTTREDLKLAVFDFDSTLCEVETLDEFAKNLDLYDEIREITAKGMNGEIDFFTSITSRIKLLKGIRKKPLEGIYKEFELTKGAIEIVKYLKEQNYRVVVFSGGFDIVLNYFSPILGVDTFFANKLHFDEDDKLTGQIGGEMMFNDSKGRMIERLQDLLGVSRENTLVVGDGANDISMFEFASLRVAFCAKETLKAHANIIIDERDLMKIKDYL